MKRTLADGRELGSPTMHHQAGGVRVCNACRLGSAWLARAAAVLVLTLAAAPLVLAQGVKPAPKNPPPAAPTQQVIRGRVLAIVDGDMFHLKTATVTYVVQLAGVDAPEKGQSFGNTAAQVLYLKLFDKDVDVLLVGLPAGPAIRGIVYCEGCVNTALVREGIAWHDDRNCVSSTLAKAQDEARTAARGLWAEKDPLPPWTWREQHGTSASRATDSTEDLSGMFGAESPTAAKPSAQGRPAAAGGPYWLSESSGIRHNSACRYYRKSKGRTCGREEGRPCKICGG